MRFVWLLALAVASPVYAVGVHVDDIEYQDWVNIAVPEFASALEIMSMANDIGVEVEDLQGADSTAQFCETLHGTGAANCASSGQVNFDVAQRVQRLHNNVTQVWNCANNGT